MTHAANDRSLSISQRTANPLSQSIPSTADFQRNQQQIAQLLAQLNQIVLDKPQAVRLALSCILAGGHLLLQDLPGMGKTTFDLTFPNLFLVSKNCFGIVFSPKMSSFA